MILEAHIGIGLYGNEGMRAVQSSDFALGEFRFLWRLVLVHGRWNYLRNAEMILYFFYKNAVFTFPQFMFAFICGFSAQTIFDDYYITFYNMVFTALPLMVKAVFEQDINYKPNLDHFRYFFPALYYVGQRSLIFSATNYLKWIVEAALHSVVVFIVAYWSHRDAILHEDGRNNDLWSFSVTVFTAVILIVTLKLVLYTRMLNWVSALSFTLLSLAPYFGYVWVTNYLEFSNTHLSIEVTFSSS